MDTLILVSIINLLMFLVTLVAVVALIRDHKDFKRLFPVLILSLVLISCQPEQQVEPKQQATEAELLRGTYTGTLLIQRAVVVGNNRAILTLTSDKLTYDYSLNEKQYKEEV